MKEIIGDMFSDRIAKQFDVICITTSGSIKTNGKAVMGAGNAKEARDTFYDIDGTLGELILKNGNNVQFIQKMFIPITHKIYSVSLLSFPTKYHWHEKSDLHLIERSIHQLVQLVTNTIGWNKVLLPRPGCQNGKRKWLSEVKPILKRHLDDKFSVIRRK